MSLAEVANATISTLPPPPTLDEDQVVNPNLVQLRQLIETVKQQLNISALNITIATLRGLIVQDNHQEQPCKAAHRLLIMALLVRFVAYRWIEDIEECLRLLPVVDGSISTPISQALATGVAQDGQTLHLAFEAIQNFANSVDPDNLDATIRFWEKSLGPGSLTDTNTNVQALFLTGNALVMKYLQKKEVDTLEQASTKFQESEALCQNSDPWKYSCLLSLAHIEGLKYIEGRDLMGVSQMRTYLRRAGADDKDGVDSYVVGERLLNSGPQVDEAISVLSLSLSRRMAPHPRRAKSLSMLAIALWTRFLSKIHVQDLEGCVNYHREALSLLPAPHLNRPAALNNLASALISQGEVMGSLQDVKTGLSLFLEALELRPAPHPQRSSSLTNLANAFHTAFELSGDLISLDQCIRYHREALASRPVPHSDRSWSLNDLAGVLSQRSQYQNNHQDLNECIMYYKESLSLTSPNHRSYANALNGLGGALRIRFQKQGDIQDLEDCIHLHEEALQLRPVPHPLRYLSLDKLASALSTRFEHKGDFQDLDISISYSKEALKLAPASHTDHSSLLTNLGASLSIRYEHKGDVQDLNQCIVHQTEVLSTTPASHPRRPLILDNLASSLLQRFNTIGGIEHLEKAISLHREALSLRPAPQTLRSQSLHGLAVALVIRFQQTGGFQDLEEGISYVREAIALDASGSDLDVLMHTLSCALLLQFEQTGDPQDLEECLLRTNEALLLMPNGHPNRPSTLGNLAIGLLNRFEQHGDFQDLEDCITLNREILSLLPSTHPKRCRLLSDLGNALSTRFEYNGNSQDLVECISYQREALELTASPSPRRALSLNSISSSLMALFRQNQDHRILDECISHQTEALTLTTASNPLRSVLLNNLGSAKLALFWKTKHAPDLEACLSVYEEGLELRPSPHPFRPSSLHNISSALYGRFQVQGAESDLEKSMALLREAVNSKTGSFLNRLQYSKVWAERAEKHRPSIAIEAYQCAMNLLPVLASLDLTLRQRQNVLIHARYLASNAAGCAVRERQLEAAVVFLSTGRSIFWSQALQLRRPIDQLATIYPHLLEELRVTSRLLEDASYLERKVASLISDGRAQLAVRSDSFNLHSLVKRRNKVLGEIRQIDGLEKFLLPLSFDSLQQAAVNGPIILLNATPSTCDALILRSNLPVQHVPLSNIQYKDLVNLKTAIQQLVRGGDVNYASIEDLENSFLRGLVRKPSSTTNSVQEGLRKILKILWLLIVEPIIKSLGLEKTNRPSRIWWCPAVIFSFLPIHAAGIYYNDGVGECLPDYAISSYCTSPQDLLPSASETLPNFKMLAVAEPEAAGAAYLPNTIKELDMIRARIPHPDNLIDKVGSEASPTSVEDILDVVQQSSFVHFGCHGIQNVEDPLQSFLLLSGGKLTMSSLIRKLQTSKAAFAFLSACQTATSDEARPDESLNLVATMLFAGFRGVVGTMWSIFDADAPVVADVFYRHLFRHGTAVAPDVTDAAYGLHLAVEELRRQGAPFLNWVPFVHYGV